MAGASYRVPGSGQRETSAVDSVYVFGASHDKLVEFPGFVTACFVTFGRVASQDSEEEPLQSQSEGGNGRERMSFEGFSEMSQRELGGAIRYHLGWFAQSSERRSNSGLSVWKSSPEMIGGGITESAIEITKSLQFVSRFYSGLEKLPQAVGREKEVFDSVSDPHAESSPTACGSMPVTAEDSSRPDRFVQLMILIIATQETVLDEGSHSLAMRAGIHF
jgi:hypothetical protein